MGTEKKAKQVIVMRKDLNMRKGKLIAQGAHASLGAVWYIESEAEEPSQYREAYVAWRLGKFTKICVYVNSESELLEIKEAAFMYDVPFFLVTDAGLTEFHGVPTLTCLAIGPAWSEEIDKITGGLPLL